MSTTRNIALIYGFIADFSQVRVSVAFGERAPYMSEFIGEYCDHRGIAYDVGDGEGSRAIIGHEIAELNDVERCSAFYLEVPPHHGLAHADLDALKAARKFFQDAGAECGPDKMIAAYQVY